MVYIMNLCSIAIGKSLKHLDFNNAINMLFFVWFYLLFFYKMKKSFFVLFGLIVTVFLAGCNSTKGQEENNPVNNDVNLEEEIVVTNEVGLNTPEDRIAACEERVWFYLNFGNGTFEWEDESEGWASFIRYGHVVYEKWWEKWEADVECFIDMVDGSINVEFSNQNSLWAIDDEIMDDEYIYDDEIIEWDDEDNQPYEEEKVVVDEIVNCDGCVFAYFSDEGDEAKTLGSTLSEGEYTTDITAIKTNGGKQRHNFFGLVLSEGKISRAYSCILKNNKIYCIEGSTDGAYHSNNIGILNQIFTADQCKYISDGHTYTCTDGSYNGDTKTHGYTSLHYETSCTIYGADANPGKLICH